MLSGRQSFLVSLSFHLGLLIVLLVAGVIMAHKLGKREPMELDLLAPVQVGPEQSQGAPKTPDEPEPEPVITKHVIEEDTFDPNRSLDLSEIPTIPREDFTPYTPNVTVSTEGGGGGGSNYAALIKAACTRNWIPPGRGVLGRPVPSTDVEITVARDGRILGHRITRPSGNAGLDQSVVQAIERSNPLPAFPRELTGAQRKFQITFYPEE